MDKEIGEKRCSNSYAADQVQHTRLAGACRSRGLVTACNVSFLMACHLRRSWEEELTVASYLHFPALHSKGQQDTAL